MTPRILALDAAGHDGEVEIDGDEHHYLTRVLRTRPGEAVELFDGRGSRSVRRLLASGASRSTLSSGSWLRTAPATRLRIELVQAISSAEKMDWTIEKAVELGVATIQPVTSARSIVRLDARRAESRQAHWMKLCVAACRQCGRDELPLLDAIAPLPAVVGATRAQTVCLQLAAPGPGDPLRPISSLLLGAGDTPLAEALSGRRTIRLLAGPESGLDDTEVRLASEHGFSAVQLGGLTLRTETAALAAIATLRALAGEF